MISNRPFGSKPSALDPLEMEYIFWLWASANSVPVPAIDSVGIDDSDYYYQLIVAL